jgi:uncharacterized protein
MMRFLLGLVLAFTFSFPSLAAVSLQEEHYQLKSGEGHDEIQQAKSAVLIGDYATALRILEPLAESGDPVAQLNLGVMYRRGHGLEQDEARGLQLYKLSAEQGFAGAQHNLGAVLLNSATTLAERSAAVELFKLAAEQGNEPSAQVLDELFKIGLEAAKSGNYEEALKNWAPLAESGSAQAQMNLGTMYSKGDGVKKDQKLAFSFYLKAAEQGIMKGQFLVGQMYQDGEGTDKKPVEALKWFLRAAKQGDSNSQVMLSAALALGEVVQRDALGSLFWAYAAEIEGNEDAAPIVQMLEKAISKKTDPSKLLQMKELVRECVKKNYEGC